MKTHVFFAVYIAAGGAFATMATAVSLDITDTFDAMRAAPMSASAGEIEDAEHFALPACAVAIDAPQQIRPSFHTMAALTIRRLTGARPGTEIVPLAPVGYHDLIVMVQEPGFEQSGGRFLHLEAPGFHAIAAERVVMIEREVNPALSSPAARRLPVDLDLLAQQLLIRAEAMRAA